MLFLSLFLSLSCWLDASLIATIIRRAFLFSFLLLLLLLFWDFAYNHSFWGYIFLFCFVCLFVCFAFNPNSFESTHLCVDVVVVFLFSQNNIQLTFVHQNWKKKKQNKIVKYKGQTNKSHHLHCFPSKKTRIKIENSKKGSTYAHTIEGDKYQRTTQKEKLVKSFSKAFLILSEVLLNTFFWILLRYLRPLLQLVVKLWSRCSLVGSVSAH